MKKNGTGHGTGDRSLSRLMEKLLRISRRSFFSITAYSYDVMRRRIQALAPNGGSVDSVYTDDLLTGRCGKGAVPSPENSASIIIKRSTGA